MKVNISKIKQDFIDNLEKIGPLSIESKSAILEKIEVKYHKKKRHCCTFW